MSAKRPAPVAKPAARPSQGPRTERRPGWWRRFLRPRSPEAPEGGSDVLTAIEGLHDRIERAVADGLAAGLEEAALKLEESKNAKREAVQAENRLRYQLKQLVEDAAAGRQAAAMGHALPGGQGADPGLAGAQGGGEQVPGMQDPGALAAPDDHARMKLPFEA